MTRQRTATANLERHPRSSEQIEVPVKRIRIVITRQHVEDARWAMFLDPVSMAIGQHTRDCAPSVHWQSDSWRPRYHDDEADVHIYQEVMDAHGQVVGELHHQTKLPRRAERAMKKLSADGIDSWKDTAMSIDIPVSMLKGRSPEHLQPDP